MGNQVGGEHLDALEVDRHVVAEELEHLVVHLFLRPAQFLLLLAHHLVNCCSVFLQVLLGVGEREQVLEDNGGAVVQAAALLEHNPAQFLQQLRSCSLYSGVLVHEQVGDGLHHRVLEHLLLRREDSVLRGRGERAVRVNRGRSLESLGGSLAVELLAPDPAVVPVEEVQAEAEHFLVQNRFGVFPRKQTDQVIQSKHSVAQVFLLKQVKCFHDEKSKKLLSIGQPGFIVGYHADDGYWNVLREGGFGDGEDLFLEDFKNSLRQVLRVLLEPFAQVLKQLSVQNRYLEFSVVLEFEVQLFEVVGE